MTTASSAILSQIQQEAFAWAKKNFAKTATAEVQLLGLCEEHGEAMRNIADTDEFLDACGDSAIFLAQFCSLMGWRLGDLWEARECSELEMPSRPWPILIGEICHHYVKGHVQLYRGSPEEHDEKCKAKISTLLLHWEQRLKLMNRDFVTVVAETWANVAQRDWTKVRPAPGADDEDAKL